MFQPRPAVLGTFLAVSVVMRLLPYVLFRFGMNIDPGTTVYPWNFSPLPAVCLFGAAYLPRKSWAYLVPLGALLLGDLGIWALTGRFDWAFYGAQPVVYACIALQVTLGLVLRKHRTVPMIAATGLVSASLFFLITNFAVWALNDGLTYPLTAEGLTACYVAAIPFFRNSLVSLAVFCPLLFSSFALFEQSEQQRQSVATGQRI